MIGGRIVFQNLRGGLGKCFRDTTKILQSHPSPKQGIIIIMTIRGHDVHVIELMCGRKANTFISTVFSLPFHLTSTSH